MRNGKICKQTENSGILINLFSRKLDSCARKRFSVDRQKKINDNSLFTYFSISIKCDLSEGLCYLTC